VGRSATRAERWLTRLIYEQCLDNGDGGALREKQRWSSLHRLLDGFLDGWVVMVMVMVMIICRGV
jgi:hypothetical protein